MSDIDTRTMALSARAASRHLRTLPASVRVSILNEIADSIVRQESEILAENAKDLAASSSLPPAMAQRLGLKPEKLQALVAGVRQMASAEDPLGRVLRRTELAPGLELRQETVPIGVLLVIFEARPDALIQVASLSIQSGNGLLLKGGREALYSNRILHRIVIDAVSSQGVNPGLIGLVESRDTVESLLKHDDVIDLVIPRGSGEMVRHIQSSTRIPVLGHADGVCHVFLPSPVSDEAMAVRIVVDSKTDYPAACNAMETLLLTIEVAKSEYGAKVIAALREKGVVLHKGPRAAALALPLFEDMELNPNLSTEYSDLAATVEIVGDVREAIEHINKYGSGHTDAIVTDDAHLAAVFQAGVDSACAFHNASTRCAMGNSVDTTPFICNANACSSPIIDLRMGTASAWARKWALQRDGFTRAGPLGWRASSQQNGSCVARAMSLLNSRREDTLTRRCLLTRRRLHIKQCCGVAV